MILVNYSVKNAIVYMSLIFDTQILVALIAINLTLIALTSLAESKKVIGIEYGKYLVNEYTFFTPSWLPMISIRLKQLLFLFMVLNGVALAVLYLTQNSIALKIVSTSLVFCLLALLFYFFSYILTVNKNVKKQIYWSTLSCMYTSINEIDLESGTKRGHSFFDTKLDICDGSPTKRKVHASVFKYFDEDSPFVEESFNEIFSWKSFIYNSQDRRKIMHFIEGYNNKVFDENDKIIKVQVNNNYKYRRCEKNYDISHEFFQMFRYIERQDKWAIHMYELATGKNKNFISFSNIVRILCNTSLFGNSNGVRSYKYSVFIIEEYLKNTKCKNVLEEYIRSKNNVLDPSGKEDYNPKMDFIGIEEIFMDNYFEVILAGIAHSIEIKNYHSITEFNECVKKALEGNTFLTREKKIKIFKNDFVKISALENNVTMAVLSEDIKKLF